MGMDQDPRHAERIGHEAGVLPARAAEALQGVAGDVMPALHADLLDRVGHVVHCDAQEPLGHFLGAARGLARLGRDGLGHVVEFAADHLRIERLIALPPEDTGK